MKITDDIRKLIQLTLKEDIGDGDHSSLSCIPADAPGKMKLLVKQDGILCGVDVAREVLRQVDDTIQMEQFMQDGDAIRKGDIVFQLQGPARSMLTAERTLLNFMQRMSGIATTTHEYVEMVKDTSVTLLDTRKTTPNMRIFEKYAVTVGGAQNHRFGLFDMMMLKDNHIDFAGGIEKAIDAANAYQKEHGLHLNIEIETRSLDDVRRVIAHGGVQRIMFDNFSPDQIREGVALVNHRFETEASGGIVKETLHDYAVTGVDFISVGAFTHHIASLDMSLKTIIL
ncbi:MAG: carboxylating nicotinate-nucleotide diphosphorylase [Bacteroidales bacterium]|nr:carboxylating nicotinate-nucleotide diphosphorylase [Bacteroidales bacterium]MBR6160257.1 carboxylating nicotinate-nucleotide diphosphorylase [Bacteroidales bacterium]